MARSPNANEEPPNHSPLNNTPRPKLPLESLHSVWFTGQTSFYPLKSLNRAGECGFSTQPRPTKIYDSTSTNWKRFATKRESAVKQPKGKSKLVTKPKSNLGRFQKAIWYFGRHTHSNSNTNFLPSGQGLSESNKPLGRAPIVSRL